jgi:long-subunit acyl-CoA synthetase (AMP-forming)
MSIKRLRAAPIIDEVSLIKTPSGTEAKITLDPRIVQGRALQQGLADDSVEAAARDPRVQHMIRELVNETNARVAVEEQIVRHEITVRDRPSERYQRFEVVPPSALVVAPQEPRRSPKLEASRCSLGEWRSGRRILQRLISCCAAAREWRIAARAIHGSRLVRRARFSTSR